MSLRIQFFALAFAVGCIGQTSEAAPRWDQVPPSEPLPPGGKVARVEVNGISMFTASYGEGPSILLIHGGLGSADDWGPLIPRLVAAKHRVIVADTRGFGRSTRDNRSYSYRLLADDYLLLLKKLSVRHVFVAGTSDGAIIALEMALADQDHRLTGLFLQGANLNDAGIRRPPLHLGAIRDALGRSRKDYDRLSATPSDYATFRKQLDAMPSPDIAIASLKSISVPTCVAEADHEESIPHEQTAAIAAAIPHARWILLKGVSHFAPLQDPEGFVRDVLRCARDSSHRPLHSSG